MDSRRFDKPATDVRPYRSHRYDMFGPKVERRLTLFGVHAFHLWLQLEADPEVVTYCERPLIFDAAGQSRVVDFWVRTKKDEVLQLVLHSSEAERVARGECLYPAFDAWSRANSMDLCLILSDEIEAREILCRNRITMLNYQSMSHGRSNSALLEEVVRACSASCTLNSLEQQFDSVELTLLRAAAFSLVLSGRLSCPTLAVRPLDRETSLVAR